VAGRSRWKTRKRRGQLRWDPKEVWAGGSEIIFWDKLQIGGVPGWPICRGMSRGKRVEGGGGQGPSVLSHHDWMLGVNGKRKKVRLKKYNTESKKTRLSLKGVVLGVEKRSAPLRRHPQDRF